MKKTNIELKREYYSQPELYFTPKMIDAVIENYGDKPATSGEAFYVVNYHFRQLAKEIIKSLPFIGRSFK